MAQAKLSEVSKKELADAYSKLKGSIKRKRENEKAKTEQLVADVVTLASAGGLGYYMGRLESEAGVGASEEDIAEKQQLAGIDLDLAIGGGLAVVGLMDMAGGMSNTVRAAGIGGLSAWAARVGREKGLESEA